MEVQVLGTKFNIKAYTDDQAIFTTLVSGSVQIKERESAHTALLRPDEQCIYTTHDGRMRIHTVDPQVFFRDGYTGVLSLKTRHWKKY